MSVSTEDLKACVLEWAREHEPEKHDTTLALLPRPVLGRRALVRLIEIRAAQDRSWRDSLPLDILDLTHLTVRVRPRGSTTVYTVSGVRGTGAQLRFGMLALPAAAFADLCRTIDAFDTEVVDYVR